MIWGFSFSFYLKSLVGLFLYLNMEGPGQLVTALCPHAFILSVMEGMEGQVLYFLVILEQTWENSIKCYVLHNIYSII